MKRARMVLAALAAAACTDPSATIFEQPSRAPFEVSPGLFRMTFNPGPDYARGFSADGSRLIYRSSGLAPYGLQWRILSIPIEEGAAREEAGIYRASLLDSVGSFVSRPADRVLVLWKPAFPTASTCGGTCLGLPVWAFSLLLLPAEDGAALAGLPMRSVTTQTVEGVGSLTQRMRITPAEVEAGDLGTNPFGPAMVPGSTIGYYSDGDVVWRFDAADPTAAVDSLGRGAYPALSADGSLLAFSEPTGVDSTIVVCRVPFALAECVQTTVRMTYTGWNTTVIHRETGQVVLSVNGAEPVFHPTQPRLLLRRVSGLFFAELSDGSSPGVFTVTAGGRSAAISPDGSAIVYTQGTGTLTDIYLLRLNAAAR